MDLGPTKITKKRLEKIKMNILTSTRGLELYVEIKKY